MLNGYNQRLLNQENDVQNAYGINADLINQNVQDNNENDDCEFKIEMNGKIYDRNIDEITNIGTTINNAHSALLMNYNRDKDTLMIMHDTRIFYFRLDNHEDDIKAKAILLHEKINSMYIYINM